MNSFRNRKGFVELKLQLVLQVIVVLIFIVLFANIIRGFGYPHRQTAFANIELLRSSMNKACATGNPVEIDGFELPQNIPPDFGGLVSIVPKMWTRTNGDPTYVLYYENFPPGEAIGWEAYIETNFRFITPYSTLNNIILNNYLKDLDGLAIKEAAEVLDRYRNTVYKKYESSGQVASTSFDAIVFSNIVLSNNIPQENVQGQEVPDSLGIQGDIGNWENKDLGDSYKFYRFNAYQLLPTINKTLVKYRSCGAGNLCLKTSDGVYAFPLTGCKKSDGSLKIKYVQLIYDVQNKYAVLDSLANVGTGAGILVAQIAIKALIKKIASTAIIKLIGGVAARLGVGLIGGPIGAAISIGITLWGIYDIAKGLLAEPFNAFYLEKTSDFYLASPCQYRSKVVIEYSNNCVDPTGDKEQCQHMISYPTYEVDDKGKLNKIGEHYSCTDYNGKLFKEDSDNYDPVNMVSSAPCLKIKFISDRYPKNDFCWTGNVRRLSYNDFLLQPVMSSSTYLKDYNGVVLSDSSISNKLLEVEQEKINTFVKNAISPIKWTWPGSKWK